jgi:hypothetical protein
MVGRPSAGFIYYPEMGQALYRRFNEYQVQATMVEIKSQPFLIWIYRLRKQVIPQNARALGNKERYSS